MKNKWIEVKSAGQIPPGSREILKYRINGSLTNGLNGQVFTPSDAERALNDEGNKVEYNR